MDNTAFDETVYDFAFDLAPDYVAMQLADDPPALHRKVIRGGSWKDIGYYCQTGTRAYEYSDTAKAYIGFDQLWHTWVVENLDLRMNGTSLITQK